MTRSLQLWLALLGAVFLIGLLLHGLWQARRAGGGGWARGRGRPAAPRSEAMASRQFEPTFANPEAVVEPVWDEAAASATAAAAAGAGPSTARPGLGVRRVAEQHIDALIDAIAALRIDTPVAGEAVIAHLPHSRRAGSKPLLIEGHNTRTGSWEAPRAGAWYAELQAGVQLASRTGAINEIEYSEFIQKVQAFADAINASPEFPDMLDVVARGRELDAFSSSHDAQLVMRLRARKSAWPLALVQQHAGRHGFVHGLAAGRLVLPGSEEGAPPMLSLHYDPQVALAALAEEAAGAKARLEEITLAFDVPQTPEADAPFNAWCAAGRALALSLDAHIFDDEGRLLQPEALPAVGQDLSHLYARLAERELAAGSPAARRLFS